jgi:hypothetical protein
MSFYCGDPCGEKILPIPNERGDGGTYQCANGHIRGAWSDRGRLDIGITLPPELPHNEPFQMFEERFEGIIGIREDTFPRIETKETP